MIGPTFFNNNVCNFYVIKRWLIYLEIIIREPIRSRIYSHNVQKLRQLRIMTSEKLLCHVLKYITS